MKTLPSPYPEEILYSIIARYNLRRGVNSKPETMEDLFGNHQSRIAIELPLHLEYLCKESFIGYSPKELIENHTSFPYYAFFLPEQKALKLYNTMLEGTISPQVTVGLHSSRNEKLVMDLRCCPLCISDDFQNYGEPYWHRIHQLPGTKVCPIHNVVLYESCPSCGGPLLDAENRGFQVTPTHCSNLHPLTLAITNNDEYLYRIACDNAEILSMKSYGRDTVVIRQSYINVLQNKGLCTSTGIPSYSKIIDGITDYFSAKRLDNLGVPIPIYVGKETRNWVIYLCKKRKKNLHPIYHVLFMQFLSGSLGGFLNEPEHLPFGQGPWPCLNKISKHFRQHIIYEVDVYIKNGKTLGKFTCSCGFSYVRPVESDPYTYTSISDYGYEWENKLKGLLQKYPDNLAYIVSEMHSNFTTIKRFKNRFEQKSDNFREKFSIEWHLKKFLAIREQYPNATRNELQRLCPTAYKWLMKNDKNEFEKMLPEVKKYKNSRRSEIRRVNWDMRDEELSKKLIHGILKLQNSIDPPKRRTKALFERIIGFRLAEDSVTKMPKLNSIILTYEETRDDYLLRKAEWLISKMIETSEKIAPYLICKKLGHPISQHVKEFIIGKLYGIEMSIIQGIELELEESLQEVAVTADEPE